MKGKTVNVPPPEKGNKRGVKLKESDIRQEAYEQYCNHIAVGYPKEAFHFDNDEYSVSWKTLERYMRESPSEFPSIKMEKAQSARYKKWFGEGVNLIHGKHKGGSPMVWQVIMRNIFKPYGWDREEIKEDSRTHGEQIAKAIRNEFVSESEVSDSEVEQPD